MKKVEPTLKINRNLWGGKLDRFFFVDIVVNNYLWDEAADKTSLLYCVV